MDMTSRFIGFNDTDILKAEYARSVAAEDYGWITLMMGFQSARLLPADEKDELALRLRADGVAEDDVQSFQKSDMFIEATDADGVTSYIVVEVSITVNRRNTGWAMRNAEYLTKLTGKPARAAVAGAFWDGRVRHLIDSGEVYWHAFADKVVEILNGERN